MCKNQVLFAVFLLSRRIISMSYLVEKILLWNILIVGLMSKYDVILYNLSQQKVCTFFNFWLIFWIVLVILLAKNIFLSRLYCTFLWKSMDLKKYKIIKF